MILGGILQSMGALKGNRVCLSLTLSVSGASARRCTAPPMSGSQPNISTCACRFFFIAACEIMARLPLLSSAADIPPYEAMSEKCHNRS